LSGDYFAIFVGFLASILLTPVIAGLWQRFSPPRVSVPKIDGELCSRGERVRRESLVVTFGALAVLTIVLGFSRPFQGWLVALILGGLIAIPALWVCARVYFGYLTRAEFRRYFEHEHRISLESAASVSAGALIVSVVSAVMLLL
jgi:hypothetical protein